MKDIDGEEGKGGGEGVRVEVVLVLWGVAEEGGIGQVGKEVVVWPSDLGKVDGG